MPTILRKDGFRFYFYSNENDEPAQIHVQRGDAGGKIWLMPKLELEFMYGFRDAEGTQIAIISFEYSEQFKTEWDGYFNK